MRINTRNDGQGQDSEGTKMKCWAFSHGFGCCGFVGFLPDILNVILCYLLQCYLPRILVHLHVI